MAKLTLADLTSTYDAVTQINQNFTDIETAIENTLSRDGTTPNNMTADIDLNSNKLLNVEDGVAASDGTNLGQVTQRINEASGDFLGTANASQVNIVDAGGHYGATEVEGALQEVFDDLGAVTTGNGASRIGIEDAGALYTGTDVEAALAEVAVSATESAEGRAEIATQAEVDAGTDDVRFVTPLKLANAATVVNIDQGSFTGTLTGMTMATTASMKYTITGETCTIYNAFSDAIGTSNSTAMTMTGLPVAARPITDTAVIVEVVSDTGNFPAVAEIGPAGFDTVQFKIGSPFSSAGFTASGNKGIESTFSMTYSLDP